MSDSEQQRLLFRDAMANLPAAVNIVTTSGKAGRCGITATAVCSVTDTPPTLMVCINRNSAMNPVFERNGEMCVNVLSHAQEEMARHFAGMTGVTMEQRFALEGWHEGVRGQPVLHQALASLEGDIREIQSIGTHFVYLLDVRHIRVAQEGHGLIYFRRRFHVTPHEEMMVSA